MLARRSRSRCSRSRSRASSASPRARTAPRALPADARRSARVLAASESSSAITTNSSPPRRPSASVSRTTPSSLSATARSSSSPAPWLSVSLTLLKLSISMNSAATGVWWRRARTSICSVRSRINVRFGSPVNASWVAMNASSSSRSLALGFKDLGHSHEGHVEGELHHGQGPGERLRRDAQVRGAVAQHLIHRVAPAQAALGHLIQRRGALGGQLAVEVPGVGARVTRHIGWLACEPARERDGRGLADLFGALLERGTRVQASGARDRQLEHIRHACVECLTEAVYVRCGLGPSSGRRLRIRSRAPGWPSQRRPAEVARRCVGHGQPTAEAGRRPALWRGVASRARTSSGLIATASLQTTRLRPPSFAVYSTRSASR